MIDYVINSLNNGQNIIPVIGFDLIPVKVTDQNGVENHVPYLDYLSECIGTHENIP